MDGVAKSEGLNIPSFGHGAFAINSVLKINEIRTNRNKIGTFMTFKYTLDFVLSGVSSYGGWAGAAVGTVYYLYDKHIGIVRTYNQMYKWNPSDNSIKRYQSFSKPYKDVSTSNAFGAFK